MVSGLNIIPIIQTSQTDEYLGTAVLSIYSENINLRGSYEIAIKCVDTHLKSSTIYLPIVIKH